LIFRIIAGPGPFLLNAFSVSLAAWSCSAGILLYHFYTINWLTSIWTVIVSPLIAIVSIMGYLKMIVAFVLPSAAAGLGSIANELSSLLIWTVKLFASWNISEILTGKVPAGIVVFYYSLMFFAGFACFRRPLVKSVIVTAAALAIIVFLGATKWQRTHRDSLYLTCLDVGHGQAILAQLPGKGNILFDAGSLHISNIGNRTVVPFLNYSGISKIDCIIVSHNDVDHINGIPEIIENCRVSGVYANEAFFEEKQKETAKFLNDWMNKLNKKRLKKHKDFNLNSGAKIKFLWPDKLADANERLSENDKSTVLLIEFAGSTMLLCSDIEKTAQARLVKFFPALNPDVVVVPHHGSVRTTNAGFIENLQPKILIYSCDRKQYERLQPLDSKNKTRSFYTAKDGATTICINKNGSISTSAFGK
jgi:competence protein ComEC